MQKNAASPIRKNDSLRRRDFVGRRDVRSIIRIPVVSRMKSNGADAGSERVARLIVAACARARQGGCIYLRLHSAEDRC